MPRKPNLFMAARGNVVEGYILLKKKKKGANMPPNWIERAFEARKNREDKVASLLQSKSIDNLLLTGGIWEKIWKKFKPLKELSILVQWQKRYEIENFYKGIRVLFELERHGTSKR